MTRETFIDGNKTILDTDFYLYLLKCESNQNKLISFLEDKIKHCNEIIEMYKDNENVRELEEFYTKNAYQEVLDFVNKGGKNE